MSHDGRSKLKKKPYCFLPGMILIAESVALGSSGALGTSGPQANGQRLGERYAGFTVTKTGSKTGRYTLTFHKKYTALLYGHAVVVGADDDPYTDAKGSICILRDDDLATDGTIEVQFLRNTTHADTEVIDSATLKLFLILADTTLIS